MSRAGPTTPNCGFLERCSLRVTGWAGGTSAFAIAVGVVLVWALTGPLFHFSDTWQLVINTGTTIVTFLMVFLIQRAQNKEAKAVQLKLNEIVAAVQGASNRLIDVENLSEAEITRLQEHFRELADRTKQEGNFQTSHSIEEAEQALGRRSKMKPKKSVEA
ncbi:MAG: low affinity iron permease family protein [Acidobacteriota bacterium]